MSINKNANARKSSFRLTCYLHNMHYARLCNLTAFCYRILQPALIPAKAYNRASGGSWGQLDRRRVVLPVAQSFLSSELSRRVSAGYGAAPIHIDTCHMLFILLRQSRNIGADWDHTGRQEYKSLQLSPPTGISVEVYRLSLYRFKILMIFVIWLLSGDIWN